MAKSKKRRFLALFCFLILFAGLGTIGWLSSKNVSPIHSSPSEKRLGFGGTESEMARFRANRPPLFAFENPQESFLQAAETEAEELVANAQHEVVVPPGATIRLAAFSLRVPGTASAVTELKPIDPATLRPGVRQLPEKLLFDSAKLIRPRLSLFFEAGDELPILHVVHGAIFDARTENRIAGSAPAETRTGRWTRVDFDLQIWHDTPVEIGFNLLTGKLEESLNGRLIGGASTGPGFSTPIENFGEAAGQGGWILMEIPSATVQIHPNTIDSSYEARLFTSGMPTHFGIVVDPEAELPKIHWFRGGARSSRVLGQANDSFEFEANPESTFGFVFLPRQHRVRFKLRGLPGMPGESGLENLMDTPIPEIAIELGEDYGVAFHSGSGWLARKNGLIQAACEAAEIRPPPDFNLLVGPSGSTIPTSTSGTVLIGGGFSGRHPISPASPSSPGSGFGAIAVSPGANPFADSPKTEVFRDVTPWQLLEIFRRRCDVTIAFDVDKNHGLVIRKAEPTRLQKVRDWWAENAPGWLQF